MLLFYLYFMLDCLASHSQDTDKPQTIHLKSLFQTHTVGRSRHNIFYKQIRKMATTGLQNIGYN